MGQSVAGSHPSLLGQGLDKGALSRRPPLCLLSQEKGRSWLSGAEEKGTQGDAQVPPRWWNGSVRPRGEEGGSQEGKQGPLGPAGKGPAVANWHPVLWRRGRH